MMIDLDCEDLETLCVIFDELEEQKALSNIELYLYDVFHNAKRTYYDD